MTAPKTTVAAIASGRENPYRSRTGGRRMKHSTVEAMFSSQAKANVHSSPSAVSGARMLAHSGG